MVLSLSLSGFFPASYLLDSGFTRARRSDAKNTKTEKIDCINRELTTGNVFVKAACM